MHVLFILSLLLINSPTFGETYIIETLQDYLGVNDIYFNLIHTIIEEQ